jgi:hypothetical protein
MANYTKGKWFVDPKKESGGYHVSLAPTDDKDGESIAFIYPSGKSTEANAHLISAAPEQNEALIFVRNQIDAWVELCPELKQWTKLAITTVDKALAKAEGKS